MRVMAIKKVINTVKIADQLSMKQYPPLNNSLFYFNLVTNKFEHERTC